jgi:hypothetical protein
MPLLDYSGKAIGTIFASRSFEADLHQMRRDMVLMISLVMSGTVLMVAIIFLAFNGMVLRPVRKMAETVRNFAGDTEVEWPKGASGPVADLV